MRARLFIILLFLTSLACSIPGVATPTLTVNVDPPIEIAPAAAQIDPLILDTSNMEECTVISDAELATVLGETPSDKIPNASVGITGCSYSFTSVKGLTLNITVHTPGREVYDNVMQFIDVAEGTEPVPLGEIAVIKEKDGTVYFDLVLNGWYVSLQGYGFSRESQLALGQWLASRFKPFTSTAAADHVVAPTTAPLSGSLVDMQVTIESPAEMAGVTTLDALNAIGFMGFSLCSTLIARPFMVAFTAPPATNPPTAVSVFSIIVENGVNAGQPATALISIGTGQSDMAQVTNWEGTVTVAGDGTSGTFEVPGQVKGSWTCSFAP